MSTFYADSSALVKRHVQEIGSEWMRQISDAVTGHILMTIPASEVELVSALTRRIREGTLAFDDYRRLRADVRVAFNRNYVPIAVDPAVI